MSIRRRLGLIALLVFSAFAANAQDVPPGDNLGPETGSSVGQDLMLKDHTGTKRTFDDLKGENGLVLVWFRSVNWCPWCMMQLIDIDRRLHDQLAAKGYNLVAAGYEPVEDLADFRVRKEIRYPMLSDHGSALIRKWGLLNEGASKGPRFGYPHPIIMVIGEDGVLKEKFFEQTYRKRPAPELVLEAVSR